MEDFKKLYTVEDIAQITSLTSRTIRNYLKDGSLKGRKIGGQWRFTDEDIHRLFDVNSYITNVSRHRHQQVIDFLKGVTTEMKNTTQVCTIADCYCENEKAGHQLYEQLVKVINGRSEGTSPARFDYEFIEKENKARFYLFGDPEYIIDNLQLLQS
jgi:excisionase family DNA binding protein